MNTIVNGTATRVGPGTSSHYYVFRNGCIIQMVREANVAFHVKGQPGSRPVNRVNRDSIGIEHADVCSDPAPYTTLLYERSAELVRDIATRNGFPIRVFGIHTRDRNAATVIGHSDLRPKDDPGSYWDWDYYTQLLTWDGRSAGARPVRVVDMVAARTRAPAGWAMQRRRAISVRRCAGLRDPYGARYWLAKPHAAGTAAELSVLVLDRGLYQASLWWPRVPGANAATPVDIDVLCAVSSTSPCVDPSSQHAVVDQRSRQGGWSDVGGPFLVTNPPVEVRIRIRRDAREGGWILADALRVMKARWRGPFGLARPLATPARRPAAADSSRSTRSR